MKTLRELDAKIISLFQESYLWLLDRTGIYLATIETLLYLGSAVYLVQRYGRLGPVAWVILGLVGLVGMYQYYLQDKRMYEIFNAMAINWESGLLRRIVTGFQVGSMVGDIVLQDIASLPITLLMLCLIYLQCVKLRDRDKKPFFEKKEQLALEGT